MDRKFSKLPITLRINVASRRFRMLMARTRTTYYQVSSHRPLLTEQVSNPPLTMHFDGVFGLFPGDTN